MVDELYLQYLGVLPTPSDEEESEESESSSNTGGWSLPPPPVRPPAPSSSGTTYGPENPAPPNYGGPPPAYYGMSMPPSTSVPTHGSENTAPPKHGEAPPAHYGMSMPPSGRDPRPDDSRTDDGDSDSTRPGRIVEELQDERPDYVDPLGQSADEIYDNVIDLYYQLYIDQGTLRTNDLAESGQDPDSDWYAAQRAYRSIDRNWYGSPQPGQEKSAAESEYADEPYTVDNSGFTFHTKAHFAEHRPQVETPENFIEYAKTELPKLIPEFANSGIDWDSLTYEEAVMFYYAALSAGAAEYSDRYFLFNPENPEDLERKLDQIGNEHSFMKELIRKMSIVSPLEDLDTLLKTYGWVSEDHDENRANAEAYFQRRLKAVYEHLGRKLPNNWEEIQNDPVIMANMLVDIYPELEEKGTYKFLREDYKWTGYDMYGEEYAKLTREGEPFNPLPLAVTLLSWAYPPFGVALTVSKIYHSGVVEGDWEAAAGHAVGLAIPRLPRIFAAGSRLASSVPKLTGTANALAALSESAELAMGLDIVSYYRRGESLAAAIVPDTPEAVIENMDNILAEIQMQGIDINALPEGMSFTEWTKLTELLKLGEEMSYYELLDAIETSFRGTLRQGNPHFRRGSQ